MAIDGVIAAVSLGSEYGEQAIDLALVDRPRAPGETDDGLRGQASLRILRPRWMPAVGARIWGGASTVRIAPGPDGGERLYDRVGYTRLVERGDDAPYDE